MNIELLKKIEKMQVKIIADYLLKKIDEDSYFCFQLEVSNKTLEGCLSYVKSQAKKIATDGFAWCSDDVVFSWVYDYFMEDSINFEPKNKENNKSNKVIQEVNKDIVKNDIYEQLSLFDL